MKKVVIRTLSVIAIMIGILCLVAVIAMSVLMSKAKSSQIEDRVLASPRGGLFVDAADTRMFVQRAGSPDALAVVFIHGTGSWSETWRTSMESAQSHGYQAIAVDLPPFGYSIPPASGNYSKASQAKRLLAALDNLGIRQAVFVAHSFGAAPVMEALLANPDRAIGIVLVDAALGLQSEQTDGSDNTLQRILRNQWISERISAIFLTNPYFTDTLLRAFISKKDKATPYWVSLYQKPLSLSGSYQHVAQWLPELVAGRGFAKSDDIGAYQRIKVPVTLIWGETDTITPLSQALHMQNLIPGANLLKISKAGHIPQLEEPQMFQDALAEALSGNGPAAYR